MLRSIWTRFSKSVRRSGHQLLNELVLTRDHAGQVDGGDVSIPHHLPSFDKHMFRARWTRQQKRGRIPTACALHTAHVPDRNIGAFADRDLAARLGVTRFMTKPFANAEVVSALQDMVGP